MPSPTPTPRPKRSQVTLQVARGAGPGRPDAGEPVSSRGRHRTPDTGELPASGPDDAAVPRAAVVPARSGAPSRHATPARPDPSDRAPAPASASPASASTSPAPPEPTSHAPAPRTPASTAPEEPAARRSPLRTAPAPSAVRPAAAVPAPRSSAPAQGADDEDAVTELVAGPARRGRAEMPDGPGTGPVPGLLGLALALLALLGAIVVAAAPGVVLPVVGPVGTSPLALAGVLVTALLATACAGLGAGRHRTGRAAAVTGLVVGLAAVAASVVPLLAL